MKLTIRKAIIFYLVAVTLAVIVAWLAAYLVAWWVGMVMMTIIVADHTRYVIKKIRQNV